MQLVEGSTIAVNCSKCGSERFQVTLLPGKQRIRCTNYSSYVTVVEVTKDRDGNLSINTWTE
jgi:phage-related protein